VPVVEIDGEMLELYDQYAGAGGLELLTCSCVLSHGTEKTRLEGKMPLIVGPNQLCSSGLVMMLFLTDKTNPNQVCHCKCGTKTRRQCEQKDKFSQTLFGWKEGKAR